MKPRIVKCPCGYCGSWELRRISGALYRRYPSHGAAVVGLGGYLAQRMAAHVKKIHLARSGKVTR